jgi:hypothetical protein
MATYTANQVSIDNGSKLIIVNSNESPESVSQGDFIQIANYPLAEINRTFLNTTGNHIIELVKVWKHSDQISQPAIVVPTTVDFKATVDALKKANILVNDNTQAMQNWQTKLGEVTFKNIDETQTTIKTLKQMESDFNELMARLEAGNTEDIERVVVVGASIMFSAYGKSLTEPSVEGTQAFVDQGITGVPVYGYCFPDENMSQLLPRVQEAVAHFDAASTLFIFHGEGNSITQSRPYAGMAQATHDKFSNELDAILNAFSGTNFILSEASFRAYADPAGVFGRDAFNDEQLGSLPYNIAYNHPRILNLQPEYVDDNGFSVVDFYNHFRNDFEKILGSDGVHVTVPYGVDSIRQFLPARIKFAILGGEKPAPIIPAQKDNVTGIEAKATLSFGYKDESLQNSINVEAAKLGQEKYLKSDLGVPTPYIYSMQSSDPRSTGNNLNGANTTGIADYAGDIYCDQMVSDSCYAQQGVIITHKVKGLTPNSNYILEVVANRNSTEQRVTSLDFGSGSIDINTSEDIPQQPQSIQVMSNSQGEIAFSQTDKLGSFSYLGAFSIDRA